MYPALQQWQQGQQMKVVARSGLNVQKEHSSLQKQ
jgi:hypothetical protein